MPSAMLAFASATPIATGAFHGRDAASRLSSRARITSRRRAHCAIHCSAAPLSRRHFTRMVSALAVGVLLHPTNASAVAAPAALGSREIDEQYGYSFATPASGWTRSTASLSSFRTATVYVCDNDKDANISMVVTPVPGDFQKLTSFGTIDNILDTIIPRGAKDIEGNVISSRVDSSKNAYVIEYTIKSGGVPRHLVTVFSLQPGRYLLTLTGQSLEGTWSAQEAVIKAVADSYQLKIKE